MNTMYDCIILIAASTTATVNFNIGSVVGAIVAASVFGFIVAIIACVVHYSYSNKG